MTSSSGTKRASKRSEVTEAVARRTLRKRGSEGGILIRAKCSLPVLGLMRMTARLSESPEM